MNIHDVINNTPAPDRVAGSDKQAAQNTGAADTANKTARMTFKDVLILSPDAKRAQATARNTAPQDGGATNQPARNRRTRQAGAGNTLNTNQTAQQPATMQKTLFQQTTLNQTAGNTLNANQVGLRQKAMLNQATVNQSDAVQKTSLFQKANQTLNQNTALGATALNQNTAPGGTAPKPTVTAFENPAKVAAAIKNNMLAAEKPANANAAPAAPDTRAQDNQNKVLRNELFRTALQAQTGQNPMLDLLG